MPAGLAPLSGAALKRTLAARPPEASPALLEAALLSLPLRRGPSAGEPSEHAAASALLAWLADTSSDFATSEAQDEATLVGMEGEPAHDPRFAAVVRYRLSRKRLCRLVAEVLEAHRREHLPAAQRP